MSLVARGWNSILVICYNQRIVEYAGLEGTHQDHRVQLLSLHSTIPESHPVPESIVQMLPDLCQAGAVSPALGSCSSAQTPLDKKLFPDTQLKPPLAQLHAGFLSSVTGHRSDVIGTCPAASFGKDVEDNHISPQSFLLQAEQTK